MEKRYIQHFNMQVNIGLLILLKILREKPQHSEVKEREYVVVNSDDQLYYIEEMPTG